MKRPDFTEIETAEEFQNWYWLKEELIEICKQIQIPSQGSKFELRDRIIYAFENKGSTLPPAPKKKTSSKFNWAKASLNLDTIITDNVSFGPNFRNFMKSQLGAKFSCHSDFMDWVKANIGKTLKDAALQWQILENRKQDPNFKRNIAAHNMLAQYVRDFLEDNPDKVFKDALACWKVKKQKPLKNGFVKYQQEDLSFIKD